MSTFYLIGSQTLGHTNFGTHNSFRQHSLDFRLARLPNTEQLVAGSLRIPLQDSQGKSHNSTISVIVSGNGGKAEREILSGSILHESDSRAWLHIPLQGSSFHRLLRQGRILRLRVLLNSVLPLHPTERPQLLSFHRNVEQSKRLRRDAFVTEPPMLRKTANTSARVNNEV